MRRLTLESEGPASGDVGIAVRPEKVRLQREQPAEEFIALRGKVSEVAYYGDNSFVYVTDAVGRTISANLQNEARSTDPTVTIGEELWCAWKPRDSLVLSA